MHNTIGNTNTAAPLPLKTLIGLTKGPAPFSKEDMERLHELAAQKAKFDARKAEVSPLIENVAQGVKDQFEAFARGDGPLPTQTPESAKAIAEVARTKIRGALDRWFSNEARPVIIEVLEKLLPRLRAGRDALVSKGQAEAAAYGVPFEKTPIIFSAEKTLELVERDLKNMRGGGISEHFNIPKFLENIA